MKYNLQMKKYFFLFLVLLSSVNFIKAQEPINKNILVLVEGDYNLTSYSSAQGRELVQLLGHFKTTVTIKGVNAYSAHDLDKFDYTFYVGFSPKNEIPLEFTQDIINTSKPIVWINNGFIDFCKKQNVEKRYGFYVNQIDSLSNYNTVKTEGFLYAKGYPSINIVQISNKKAVEVWATSISSKTKKQVPYMVKSGNLVYVADLPFAFATETDRYLYFADKLHDILNENHEEKHQAIIRIEDVTPLNNPDKLREVADILSERGIPFLVGVVPIYVNPVEDRRVTLTERPEVVDALKYMVRNGGTIIMHGVTHQYKGVSTNDCEFWDGTTNKPIAGESKDAISKKIETGIDELFKNGLYPIAWETPHYEASIKSYETFAKYFSTCVEQRMVINNFDYGQYFPYTIEKDIYGQKIYPENLGYIPLSSNIDTSRNAVKRIINNSIAIRTVRDGIVSFFFHPFLDLSLLKELVDGIKDKGFTFINLREQTNMVKAQNKIIVNGSQTYKMKFDNVFLNEMYFDADAKIIKKEFTSERLNGEVTKEISLNPGEFYVGEGLDFKVKERTIKDKLLHTLNKTYTEIFGPTDWQEAKVSVYWNQYAKGSAFNDQSSLVSIFKSLNINVDTLFLGTEMNLERCNLLVVPFSCVDSLTYFDKEKIVHFVHSGGNLITDRKNKLAEKLGIKFLNSEISLHLIRDKIYPQELISWKYSQLANKFEYDANDEILCEDGTTGFPVAIGRVLGKGKFIYFNTAFDPNSPLGYSNYPYSFEYIKKFFSLSPIIKRENLDFYFDPGLRQRNSEESLVKSWVKQGIRVIHIGGWHQYAKYTYDYKRLIKLAHANGILVYAWLEPPYVSQKFWQSHPEWREKNFKGKDLIASWRYPVALTDEKCLSAVIVEYQKLLNDYDWDGVNLAELYFESGIKGFINDTLFAPMHPSACKEFKNEYKFDLKQIFNPNSEYYWKKNPKAKEDVINYRIDKIADLHERFLKVLTDYAKTKSGFGVIVTFMDSYFSPELKEIYGINSEKIVELQKKYDFQLQPEDPQNRWSTEPNRYLELGRFYARKMVDPSKLLLDLNILSFRDKNEITPFSTLTQTGIESYHLINSAASGAPRFTVYSEATCNSQDIAFFSYASSSPVKYNFIDDGYEVNSPCSFVIQLPKHIKIITVDDQAAVGYRDNKFIIPSGNHTIKLHGNEISEFSTAELQPQILSFTGNITDITYGMQQIEYSYESTERALVSLNRIPTKIKVDDQEINFEVLKGNDCFSVFLPSGKHIVQIISGNKFSYGVNLTSLWSSNAIALYGIISIILLVIMYLFLKLFRRKFEK